MPAHRPGRVAGGVDGAQFVAGDVQRVTILDGAEVLVGVRHSPQHVIGGVQQHRGVECLGEFGRHGHVVVVTMGAHHRHHVTAADGHHNWSRVVGGVEDHDFVVVTDDPDVVVDFPTAT